MRYPGDHKRKTRDRILRAAAAAFRRHGYAATGVDAVMASARLTAGAFYAHFRSKRELLAKAVDQAFRQSRRDWPSQLAGLQGRPWIRQFASFYLSREHRDAPALGCPMPSLTAEVGRNGDAARRMFEHHLRGLIETVARQVEGPARNRDAAISAIALSVGGLMLARTVTDEVLSDEILAACRAALADGVGGPKEPTCAAG